MANARRGILLNLPTAKVKTKPELNSVQEQNHEVFQSCEKLTESSGIMYDGATSSASGNDNRMKIEPPPRKKKRPTATRQIVTHPKKPILKQANQQIVKTESIEKNDSGLYRIANSNAENAKLSIEEPKKKEHVVTMVKPKVQKAVAVKAKPVQQQVAKVKSYEWNKHQRKSSIGNVPKVHPNKRYLASDPKVGGGSFKSENSVDIFQSNKLLDQRKLFDEFDALFDKSKEASGKFTDLSEVTPESAFDKLNALRRSSSTFLFESDPEDRFKHTITTDLLPAKPSIIKTQYFLKKKLSQVNYVSPSRKSIESVDEVSSKPKIVYEQPKITPGIIKKKILYYDDEHELKQLIMNQSQSTTIINNHYSATVIPASAKSSDNVEGTMPISCNPHSHAVVAATGQFDLNGNDSSEDYRRPKASETTNSNSLRIFSNEGIFVFNL